MFFITESTNSIKTNFIKLINNECKRLLSITKYGWYNFKEKKEILPNTKEWKTPNYFEKNCRVLDPHEVLKYKIGTCWDFSIYIADYIKTISFSDSYIYFVNDKNFKVTHSFVIFKNLEKNYVVEPTINNESIFGVHQIIGDNVDSFIKKFYTNINIFEINKCLASTAIKLAYKHQLTAHKFISLFNFKIEE